MKEIHAYQEFLFHVLFASVATLAFAASGYLLLRRSNGIAPDIIPPRRLRRWTSAFFASTGAGHLWWLFIRYSPLQGDPFDHILICTTLDTMITVPLLLSTMVVMLQDRRRPLWPIFLASALTCTYFLYIFISGIRSTAFIVFPSLLVLIFFILQLRALRQYDRWLLDNYADLEHKEVRTSVVVMAVFMLTSVAYSLANDYFFFEVLIEVANVLLIGVLLWRVETLQNLEVSAEEQADRSSADADPITEKLSSLLQQHCIEGQYYLRHDASLTQLAKLLGTNRYYLSQHFAQQGLNYNSYINGLRIAHFERLYQEANNRKIDVNVSELYPKCGFNSYSTFTRAFKKVKQMTLTEWLGEEPHP